MWANKSPSRGKSSFENINVGRKVALRGQKFIKQVNLGRKVALRGQKLIKKVNLGRKIALQGQQFIKKVNVGPKSRPPGAKVHEKSKFWAEKSPTLLACRGRPFSLSPSKSIEPETKRAPPCFELLMIYFSEISDELFRRFDAGANV